MAASMKGSYMKDDAAALERLPADVAARVRAQCSAALARIEAASRADWLPVSLDVELADAVASIASVDAQREQGRIALRSSLEGPLLRPLRDVTLRVFGAHPHAALRLVPRAWTMIFRDCGEISYERADTSHGVLRLRSPAPELANSAAWLAGTAGTFDALAVVGGAKHAQCEVDATSAKIEFHVRW